MEHGEGRDQSCKRWWEKSHGGRGEAQASLKDRSPRMGALYSPVETSELNRKTVGKLLATICKHNVVRFILWGSFLWLRKREWKAGKLGWTDRALRWPWQEAWAWTKTAMILLPGTRKRDFSAEWIRMWGSVSCQEWGKKGVAFSTLECGQCWTLIEPPTWGKAQFSPRGVGRRQELDGFSTSPELQPWWGSWSRPQWMIFTFTANPLRSATTEPPEGFVLGMVSVLVPRRWILDSGIFNSRLTTWILEEIFHFSWVRHRPGHIPHGSMYVEPSTPSRDQWQDHESLQPQEVPLV